MIWKTTKQTKTFQMVSDLGKDDAVLIKIGPSQLFGIRYNVASRAFELFLVNEGGFVDEEPFFTIRRSQMESLQAIGQFECVQLTISKPLYQEVKKRLAGLPIVL
jgi:hypothetical protein